MSDNELVWWGTDCEECGNATHASMRCDCCGSDKHTVSLYKIHKAATKAAAFDSVEWDRRDFEQRLP